MTRAQERWNKLTDQALDRDSHRCQLGLSGRTGEATAVVVEPSERLAPARLDQLLSACPACIQRRHPKLTAEERLVEH